MKNAVFALILTTMLMLAAPAYAVSFLAPVTTTATATSTLALAPNGFRVYLIIVNTGSQTVYVKLGSVQSANEGIPIPAGGSYEPIEAPTNGVWMKTASSTSAVTIVQGTSVTGNP